MEETAAKKTEATDGSRPGSDSGLDSIVATMVAVLATFMALCNIKDGNIVQAMAQAQAQTVDTWAYYQSKSTKQSIAESAHDQLVLQRATGGAAMTPEALGLLDKEIAAYEEKAKRYEREKEEIKKQAEESQKEYDRLNIHDDQFDMAEAALSISIALLGVAALTRKRALALVAACFAVFGTILGLAGFLGWGIHPESIAKFLT